MLKTTKKSGSVWSQQLQIGIFPFNPSCTSGWDTGSFSLGLYFLQVSSLWATTGAHGGDPKTPPESPKELSMLPCSHWAPQAAPCPAPGQPSLSALHRNEKTVSTWSCLILDITSLQLKQFRRVNEITQASFKAPSLCHLCLKTPIKIPHHQKHFLCLVFPSHLYYCCSLWYHKNQPRPTNQLSCVMAVTAGDSFHPRDCKSWIQSKIS